MLMEWLNANKLIVLLAAGTFFTFAWQLALRERLQIKWYAALPVAILLVLAGVLSVKVFAFLETGFSSDSLGNMSLFGGMFFMPMVYLAIAKLTKRNVGLVCDIFTPCMIFTVMCARINCILSGCCLGLPIPGFDGVRFPTRELEVLFYVVLLIILAPKVWRGQPHGSAYPIYMIAYGGFRFVVEFFRNKDTTSLLHLSHLWAVISLCAGISIYAEINCQKQ